MTTEGAAQLFGASTRSDCFMVKVLGLAPERAGELGRVVQRAINADRLVFSRWSQVMVRFERRLYADPEQDLVPGERLFHEVESAELGGFHSFVD